MNDDASNPEQTDDDSQTSSETGRAEARAQEPTIAEAEAPESDEHNPAPAGDDETVEPDAGNDATEGDEKNEEDVEADTGDDEPESGEAADASSAETTDDEADEERDQTSEDETQRRWNNLPAQGVEWLNGLFDRMQVDADASVENRDGTPHVDIHGPEAWQLLGRGKLGPKAVEGIETLLQSVFSQDDAAKDVYVDVDGRRAARKEMLQEVAVSMADKAVELNEKMTVSGLNSTERRIIHRKLREYDGVDTESVGDGIFRRLTIDPA